MDHTLDARQMDRRQQKSREAIQNALLDLLQTKPLDQITISELSIRADVNRKTFYNNYHSIVEVRDELQNRYLDQVFDQIQQKKPNSEMSGSLEDFFSEFFRGLQGRKDQFLLVAGNGGAPGLTEHMKDAITPYLRDCVIENRRSAAYFPYYLEYAVNGLAAITTLWLKESPVMSVEEAAALAASLVRSTADSLPR